MYSHFPRLRANCKEAAATGRLVRLLQPWASAGPAIYEVAGT
jgi:hypothetical protein